MLHTLVSIPEGAKAFVEAGDVSSLAEIAPSHAAVLDIFLFAWLNGMASVVEKHVLVLQVASTMQSLVSAFTGTDGVTLVEFVGTFLRQADPTVRAVFSLILCHYVRLPLNASSSNSSTR